jgi:hypothetical protein
MHFDSPNVAKSCHHNSMFYRSVQDSRYLCKVVAPSALVTESRLDTLFARTIPCPKLANHRGDSVCILSTCGKFTLINCERRTIAAAANCWPSAFTDIDCEEEAWPTIALLEVSGWRFLRVNWRMRIEGLCGAKGSKKCLFTHKEHVDHHSETIPPHRYLSSSVRYSWPQVSMPSDMLRNRSCQTTATHDLFI